jgi:Fe-S cluster assembly protein SufD
VDGVFRPDLSDEALLEGGISVEPLARRWPSTSTWAREIYGVLEKAGQEKVARPLAALNTAAAAEGLRGAGDRSGGRAAVLLPLPAEAEARTPAPPCRSGRGGSRADDARERARRGNKVMEVDVADEARFHHVRAQGRDHERRRPRMSSRGSAREPEFKSFTLTVNGRLTRNEVVIEFAGDDASGHIVAGACAGGAFHHDNTVFVTHSGGALREPAGVQEGAAGRARGVFQGKILVKEGAQKTDGYQISQGCC